MHRSDHFVRRVMKRQKGSGKTLKTNCKQIFSLALHKTKSSRVQALGRSTSASHIGDAESWRWRWVNGQINPWTIFHTDRINIHEDMPLDDTGFLSNNWSRIGRHADMQTDR